MLALKMLQKKPFPVIISARSIFIYRVIAFHLICLEDSIGVSPKEQPHPFTS